MCTKDKTERLESLKGWSWNPLEDDWDEGFSYLEKYVDREKHARVPSRHKEGDYLLGGWVSKQRNKKKNGEGLEVLVEKSALDKDGMRVQQQQLAERMVASEPTGVPPRISNDTTRVKTNLTTEKITLTKMATNVTATSPHPGSTAKRDSLKASSRFKGKNATEVLGYWDLLLSWLPQVWK